MAAVSVVETIAFENRAIKLHSRTSNSTALYSTTINFKIIFQSKQSKEGNHVPSTIRLVNQTCVNPSTKKTTRTKRSTSNLPLSQVHALTARVPPTTLTADFSHRLRLNSSVAVVKRKQDVESMMQEAVSSYQEVPRSKEEAANRGITR